MPVSLLGTLLLPLGLSLSPTDKTVCVPAEDGHSWVCGKGADAPAPRAMPKTHQRTRPPEPPPFLIDPARVQAVLGAAARSEPAINSTPTAPAAAAVPSAAVTPASAPATSPASALEVESAAAAVTPVSSPAPAVAAAMPTTVPPTTASTVATTTAPGPVRSIEQLLALAAGHYTIQLAAAPDPSGFEGLRLQLGLNAADTYVVPVRRNGERWSFLLWRDFTDLASARNAAAQLQGNFWPRRLGPLQQEVRAAR